MTQTPKMEHAQRSVDRRLGITWEREQLSRHRDAPPCKVGPDRLEFTTSGVNEELLLTIPGLRRTAKHLLRASSSNGFVAYQRVTVFEGTNSIQRMTVRSAKRFRRLANCVVTLIAKDKFGLQPNDVLAVTSLLPDVRLTIVEIAFDFGFTSGVSGWLVRATGLFGKAKPNQVGVFCGWDCWGNRKSAKFTRSYFKKELGVHRVELQLNRKFLRRHQINDIGDLPQLVDILPGKHIFFGDLDEEEAERQLKNVGLGLLARQKVLERVREAHGDLSFQLSILRKRGRLKNVRRVLAPMLANYLLQQALQKWARNWSKHVPEFYG
jgi:hypothetical protein